VLQRLKFSHKILATASIVLIAAFSLFMMYNDYLQRKAITQDLSSRLDELGTSASANIVNWLNGHITLLESEAQAIQNSSSSEGLFSILEQKAYLSNFEFTYLGHADGQFSIRPDDEMPAGYDSRTRDWYIAAQSQGRSLLTEPCVDAGNGKLVMTLATPVIKRGGSGRRIGR
jgi:methyl-accepting chemotaxis protein